MFTVKERKIAVPSKIIPTTLTIEAINLFLIIVKIPKPNNDAATTISVQKIASLDFPVESVIEAGTVSIPTHDIKVTVKKSVAKR